MPNSHLEQALRALEPKTKAARVREVMPVIEERIAAGVRIVDILKILQDSGIDLTKATLNTYLYQYRKKRKPVGRQGPVSQRAAAPPASVQAGESDSYETDSPETPVSRGPISMLELDRLMKPDPAKQAEEMAYYERIAKKNRRSRKP
ncbi:conjugal transfer protein TraD [Cupriavidus sp. CP313]